MTTTEIKHPIDYENPLKFYSAESPFSNFYPSPLTVDGITYPTMEHYFQAAKFRGWNDPYASKIRQAASPAHAKRLARAKRLNSKQIAQWNTMRDSIMLRGLREKFKQNNSLAYALLDTGSRELIEWSPRDLYWGANEDPISHKRRGINRLGRLLMVVREELFKEAINDSSSDDEETTPSFPPSHELMLDGDAGDMTKEYDSD